MSQLVLAFCGVTTRLGLGVVRWGSRRGSGLANAPVGVTEGREGINRLSKLAAVLCSCEGSLGYGEPHQDRRGRVLHSSVLQGCEAASQEAAVSHQRGRWALYGSTGHAPGVT